MYSLHSISNLFGILVRTNKQTLIFEIGFFSYYRRFLNEYAIYVKDTNDLINYMYVISIFDLVIKKKVERNQ